jgi:hypothetical protein
MSSKRNTVSLMTAVGILVLLGGVACKRSDTTDGTLSAPGSQIPHDSQGTVPGTRPGEATDMPANPNSR